ncbi:MAG TPA: citrate/2-methylcitrate synthase [Ilumatobacter sp.]|nr:citrate/2-methylcitrate synthase [Ilumatobacter sp.]
MTTHVSATEAARMLGVTKPTLYAYVSRGIVGRSTAADGRTSLYAREEIQQLAGRARRRESAPATIDVQISSAITELQDERLSYRGHDAAGLARDHSFEQVAELLWGGALGQRGLLWPVDRASLARCRSVHETAKAVGAIARLTLAAITLAEDSPGDDAPTAARRLLAIAPSLLGGPVNGDMATRLAAAYRRRPSPELVAAVARALVLLADHELATSTLAVRVACSVRADPYASIAAGLCVVGGPLHGTSSTLAAELLDEASVDGARTAVARVLSSGRRLPGFGHSVYRNGDPRLAPLLEAVRALPDPDGRMPVVEELLVEAGRRLGHLPNVDLGLGALAFVGGLPRDASLFAVARIAGWAAHYDEEKAERPVRYRGITTRR